MFLQTADPKLAVFYDQAERVGNAKVLFKGPTTVFVEKSGQR